MSHRPRLATSVTRDHPKAIYELLAEIAGPQTAGGDPAEIDQLVEECRRLRMEL